MRERWRLISGRERRKAERRAAIIEIAQHKFLEHGFNGTTMSAISTAMGGSKGTLWSYFSSKEKLFAACVEGAIKSFRDDLAATLDASLDVRKAVGTFAARYIEGLCQRDAIALQRLITSEGAQFPELSAIFYRQGPHETLSLLGSYIFGQMEKGTLRRDDPNVAAAMIVSLCLGGLRQRVLWGMDRYSAIQAKRDATVVVDLFWRCYRNVEASERRRFSEVLPVDNNS